MAAQSYVAVLIFICVCVLLLGAGTLAAALLAGADRGGHMLPGVFLLSLVIALVSARVLAPRLQAR
jgi:hypothetical protein